MAANLAPVVKTDEEPGAYLPDERAGRSMQLLGLTPAALKEISLEAEAASRGVIEIINPCRSVAF